MGWTRRTAAVTILQMTEAQQKEMGARVAQLRDKQGLTNESLARKAQLSVKTVSRFVHGKHEPRTNTIEALARALKVPEREIRGAPPSPFGDDDEPTSQLERIETTLEEMRAERVQHAQYVERLLQEQSELLATIRGLLGMDGKVTLQDRLVQMLRDAQAKAGPGPGPRSVPQDRS